MDVAGRADARAAAGGEPEEIGGGSAPRATSRVDPTSSGLDRLMAELDLHPVYGNAYFEQLRATPWTRETYALHRANFFHRTELTVKAVAHVCARSAEETDTRTLVLFSSILGEECGDGEYERCHAVLMERSHNVFGSLVFGLAPLPAAEASASQLVIDATHRYRRRIRELCGGSYQRLLGVAVALESHAARMLDVCRTAFRAHAAAFEHARFVEDVEVYFNVHLDAGVERRHASDARDCARRNCRSAHDLAEIAHGAHETLDVQLSMWQDLHRRAAGLATATPRGE